MRLLVGKGSLFRIELESRFTAEAIELNNCFIALTSSPPQLSNTLIKVDCLWMGKSSVNISRVDLLGGRSTTTSLLSTRLQSVISILSSTQPSLPLSTCFGESDISSDEPLVTKVDPSTGLTATPESLSSPKSLLSLSGSSVSLSESPLATPICSPESDRRGRLLATG